MRRTLGLLGIMLLTAGHHGGHGHHGSHAGSGGFEGCGGSVAHEIEVRGTVRLDPDSEGRAVITVRHGHSGAPVRGAVVRVQGAKLLELVPGTYVGPVDGLRPGEPVEIAADDHRLQGLLPERAERLALQGSAPPFAVAFDELGPALSVEVVAHSALASSSEAHSAFEENARITFPVPDLRPLTAVEVQLRSEAAGSHVLDRVSLETDAELPIH